VKVTDTKIKPYVSCEHQLSVTDEYFVKHGDELRVVVPSAIRHIFLLELLELMPELIE
jgi:hypothetical protein